MKLDNLFDQNEQQRINMISQMDYMQRLCNFERYQREKNSRKRDKEVQTEEVGSNFMVELRLQNECKILKNFISLFNAYKMTEIYL